MLDSIIDFLLASTADAVVVVELSLREAFCRIVCIFVKRERTGVRRAATDDDDDAVTLRNM